MKIPVINGWEITTNENDVKMATLPQEKMLEIMKYLEAQSKVNVTLGNASITEGELKAFIRWNNKHNGIAQPVPEKMAEHYLKSL